jgi:hypothetical protein
MVAHAAAADRDEVMVRRLILPGLGLLAAAMIALALVWPQGLGRPSPPPFGHPLPSLEAPPSASASKPRMIETPSADRP